MKTIAGLLLLIVWSPLSAQSAKPKLWFNATATEFTADGRWAPSDPSDKSGFPSETRIDCERRSRMCIEATAEMYSGHPHVSMDYYQVIQWDENGIVARSSDAICMTETLLISFADHNISATHSMKRLNKGTTDACNTFGASGTFSENFVIKNSPAWISDPYGQSFGGQR